MDLETLYRRTIDSWTDRILTVGPEQWGATTPCLEWDVRALVNHVVGEDLWTEPLVRGATIQEVGDRFKLTRERARQIEAKLTARLREWLRAEIPDFELLAPPET